jgi:hypothetical protein
VRATTDDSRHDDEYRLLHERFVFTDPPGRSGGTTAMAVTFASEHEGFCAPLVEAMAADVPILACGRRPFPKRSAGGIQFAPKDLVRCRTGRRPADDDLRASASPVSAAASWTSATQGSPGN